MYKAIPPRNPSDFTVFCVKSEVTLNTALGFDTPLSMLKRGRPMKEAGECAGDDFFAGRLDYVKRSTRLDLSWFEIHPREIYTGSDFLPCTYSQDAQIHSCRKQRRASLGLYIKINVNLIFQKICHERLHELLSQGLSLKCQYEDKHIIFRWHWMF